MPLKKRLFSIDSTHYTLQVRVVCRHLKGLNCRCKSPMELKEDVLAHSWVPQEFVQDLMVLSKTCTEARQTMWRFFCFILPSVLVQAWCHGFYFYFYKALEESWCYTLLDTHRAVWPTKSEGGECTRNTFPATKRRLGMQQGALVSQSMARCNLQCIKPRCFLFHFRLPSVDFKVGTVVGNFSLTITPLELLQPTSSGKCYGQTKAYWINPPLDQASLFKKFKSHVGILKKERRQKA